MQILLRSSYDRKILLEVKEVITSKEGDVIVVPEIRR